MKHWILLALALLPLGCRESAQQANPAVRHVLVLSIDGLRPDVALHADMPNLRQLCRNGSFTFWAKTLDWPVTLPSHTSMLTGVLPEKHGVWTNSDWAYSYAEVVRPKVPTLFESAKSAGFTTALISGKPKFESLTQPGSLDWSFVPETYSGITDIIVADHAIETIRLHQPQLLFVHLPGVDAAGHRHGWGSLQQLQAAQAADAAMGRILQQLQRQKLWDQTVILVTADHGGSGTSHWRNDDRNTHIPWILHGPKVKKSVDLTRYRELAIHTCDTYATVCHLLNIPLREELDGKPVLQALEQEELLYDVSY